MCTVCIKERYIAYGEDTHTLRLTSALVDLRVGYAKWIQWASSLSRIESSSIIVMHTCASQLWRDIEVVITGLTRNQFVLTHTRVRIPLSPPKRKNHPIGWFFLFLNGGERGGRTQWTKQPRELFCERWPKIFARHNKRKNPKRRAKIKNESLSAIF